MEDLLKQITSKVTSSVEEEIKTALAEQVNAVLDETIQKLEALKFRTEVDHLRQPEEVAEITIPRRETPARMEKPLPPINCKYCDKQFIPNVPKGVYCSKTCKDNDFNKKPERKEYKKLWNRNYIATKIEENSRRDYAKECLYCNKPTLKGPYCTDKCRKALEAEANKSGPSLSSVEETARENTIQTFEDPWDCGRCRQNQSLCRLHINMIQDGMAPAKYKTWKDT